MKKIVLDDESRLHMYFSSEVMFSGCYEVQMNSLTSQVFHPHNDLRLQLKTTQQGSCVQRHWEVIASYQVNNNFSNDF